MLASEGEKSCVASDGCNTSGYSVEAGVDSSVSVAGKYYVST